jgi:hypothetical protein
MIRRYSRGLFQQYRSQADIRSKSSEVRVQCKKSRSWQLRPRAALYCRQRPSVFLGEILFAQHELLNLAGRRLRKLFDETPDARDLVGREPVTAERD